MTHLKTFFIFSLIFLMLMSSFTFVQNGVKAESVQTPNILYIRHLSKLNNTTRAYYLGGDFDFYYTVIRQTELFAGYILFSLPSTEWGKSHLVMCYDFTTHTSYDLKYRTSGYEGSTDIYVYFEMYPEHSYFFGIYTFYSNVNEDVPFEDYFLFTASLVGLPKVYPQSSSYYNYDSVNHVITIRETPLRICRFNRDYIIQHLHENGRFTLVFREQLASINVDGTFKRDIRIPVYYKKLGKKLVGELEFLYGLSKTTGGFYYYYYAIDGSSSGQYLNLFSFPARIEYDIDLELVNDGLKFYSFTVYVNGVLVLSKTVNILLSTSDVYTSGSLWKYYSLDTVYVDTDYFLVYDAWDGEDYIVSYITQGDTSSIQLVGMVSTNVYVSGALFKDTVYNATADIRQFHFNVYSSVNKFSFLFTHNGVLPLPVMSGFFNIYKLDGENYTLLKTVLFQNSAISYNISIDSKVLINLAKTYNLTGVYVKIHVTNLWTGLSYNVNATNSSSDSIIYYIVNNSQIDNVDTYFYVKLSTVDLSSFVSYNIAFNPSLYNMNGMKIAMNKQKYQLTFYPRTSVNSSYIFYVFESINESAFKLVYSSINVTSKVIQANFYFNSSGEYRLLVFATNKYVTDSIIDTLQYIDDYVFQLYAYSYNTLPFIIIKFDISNNTNYDTIELQIIYNSSVIMSYKSSLQDFIYDMRLNETYSEKTITIKIIDNNNVVYEKSLYISSHFYVIKYDVYHESVNYSSMIGSMIYASIVSFVAIFAFTKVSASGALSLTLLIAIVLGIFFYAIAIIPLWVLILLSMIAVFYFYYVR